MQGQIAKHADTLKFLENLNRLCPWNAANLNRETLDYFVELNFLSPAERAVIEETELPLFLAFALTWVGCARPTVAEYLLRASPATLLPEARIWRFFYVHQKRIPKISLLMKRLASAQAHSGASERTGSLYTHDESAQTDAASVDTAVIRQRLHYENVVNPMQNMPCGDLAILPPLL